jgi:hypothetical protein
MHVVGGRFVPFGLSSELRAIGKMRPPESAGQRIICYVLFQVRKSFVNMTSGILQIAYGDKRAVLGED